MVGFPLETDRLLIRPYEEADLDPLSAVLCDPETLLHFPRVYTRQEVAAAIRMGIRQHRELGYALWAVVVKDPGEMIGSCGFAHRSVEGEDLVELGWHLNRRYWNRGLATEAARACRDHAFSSLGFERFVSLVVPENLPSRRVAQKLGMWVEREIVYRGLRHLVYRLEAAEAEGGAPRYPVPRGR
ncbi:MAG TPA: GNAT family N-acetyltransferase [Actinomycetota bacterium]|jgi:RimJ/RimL family protein N-acetyltransferase|nr:GNAT family N-acetyltransferase [Actinomycetota bacterium]